VTVNVVGIGGSLRTDSQSELAMRLVLAGAAEFGAKITTITGTDLMLPFYDPGDPQRTPAAKRLVEELRDADGVIIVSPGYHGGVVKNALDYIEDLRGDERIYLDGRAVGCIAVASGWQSAVTTLNSLRASVHALRGWPTPLGAAVNSTVVAFDQAGGCTDPDVAATLRLIGQQVVDFALRAAESP